MGKLIEKVDELARELKSLEPIKPELQKKIDNKFRLEFNYNSNHMEGNTLTYSETELLLIFDDTKGNHTLREYEEMKAHDVAYQLIYEWAKDLNRPLTEQNIKNLNEIILVRPYWSDAVTPDGKKTRREIKVGNYKEYPNSVRLQNGEIFDYPSPADTPILMQELIEWYRSEEGKLHPIILASMFHYKFVRIHPFDDGNGRIARLLMNYVLLRNNLAPVIIKSNDKKNYLSALHEADIQNYEPFIDYIAQQAIWSLEISVKAAKGERIEEPDDLEKELALLSKSIDVLQGEKLKSSDGIRLIWGASLYPLIEKYLKRYKSFESLFSETGVVINVTSSRQTNRTKLFYTINECDNAIKEESDLSLIERIEVTYQFKGLKKIHHNTSAHCTINFSTDEYKITIQNRFLKKRYNENIDDLEINDIVNSTAENYLKELKELINKLK
jgi:Fic family protein